MGKYEKDEAGKYVDEKAQRFADGLGPCPKLTDEEKAAATAKKTKGARKGPKKG